MVPEVDEGEVGAVPPEVEGLMAIDRCRPVHLLRPRQEAVKRKIRVYRWD